MLYDKFSLIRPAGSEFFFENDSINHGGLPLGLASILVVRISVDNIASTTGIWDIFLIQTTKPS